MINPASPANQTGLSIKSKCELIKVFFDYMDELISREVIKEPDCNQQRSDQLDQRRLLEILSKEKPSRAFVDYMEKLIQMKVREAGLDSASSLPENLIAENCGQILLEQLGNIINAKLELPDGKEMLDSISKATSKVSEQINRQLDSLAAQIDCLITPTNTMNEGHRIIAPPRIEEKEESKIRAELIKIFQIDTEIQTKILGKVNAAISRGELDPHILKDHEEEIWRAVSLIKSPSSDSLHYLKEFKVAMEKILPSELRSKLVPIIYEKPTHSIPDYIQKDSKNNPTLKFEPNCDLSGYYLRDLNFQPSGPDWDLEPNFYVNLSAAPLDFTSAKMIRADLSRSDFSSLVLNEADLTEANLTNTNFIGSELIGTKLSGAYWEEGQPPLINRKTQFIPDWFYTGVSPELPLPAQGENLLITAYPSIITRPTRIFNAMSKLARPLMHLNKKISSDSSNNQRTKTYINKIQEAFEGVTPEMKDHILRNIGLFQRRALEAILDYEDPKKKITPADIPLILPNKEPGLIIIPDEQAGNLEAGMTARGLIQEEILGEQNLKYQLDFINQQAALNNLAKVSGNHTNKDFSKREITLRGTSFDQAILDSANLSRQDLSEAVFNECRLIKTDLSGAKLQNTIFNNCDLSEVDLSEAKMQGTTFHNCNLSKSTWEKALMDGVNMINCTIKDVDIEEMTSHNWFLDHCILDNVNFKGSEEGKGIFINQMGLISSIIVNSNIEGNTNFYNVEGLGSVLAMNDPAAKLLNKDLTISDLSYVSNSPIQIALEAVLQEGSIYSTAFQDVVDNGVNFGPVNLMDLSCLSRAAIGYQPQRFERIDPRLLKSMQ
jgi:uncharacterized protein YjbI with pentapeptide repeats